MVLKTKARLKLDYATSQKTGRFAKARVVDARAVTLRLERRQVSDVEDVEKVKAEVQIWRLTQHAKARQTKSLRQTHIHVEVFRTTEHIATDSRWIRREIVAVKTRAEKCRATTRENTSRTQEVVVRIVGRLTAEKRNGPDWSKEVSVRSSQAVAENRRPRESRVARHDAVDLPATEKLPGPIILPPEDRKIPNSGQRPIMPDVIIRWSIFSALVDRERLVGTTAGRFKRVRVETLAEAINEVELKTVRKPALQTRIHRVVISFDVANREKHRREREVCFQSRLR